MPFLVGALAMALVVAVVALVVQHFQHKRERDLVLAQETRALDRMHAAELRSAQQIDAMLARIHTNPRLEVDPGKLAPTSDEPGRTYIADTPDADEAWNDYRNVPEDER